LMPRSLQSFPQKEIPLVTHLFVGGTLVLMVFLAWYNFYLYTVLSYEDHLVEWATVVFYLAAFLYGLSFAISRVRFGDGLVALYCLVAGGEEFSWGQRLLGLSPPKFFMAGNEQQEINFHNFLAGGYHDLAFASVGLGYFVLIPLLGSHRTTSAFLKKLRISIPPTTLSFWAGLLVFLHTWHPIHLSSEWYEVVLAAMFFVSAECLKRRTLSSNHFLVSVAVVLAISAGLMKFSLGQESSHDVTSISCARSETQHLLQDLITGDEATGNLELIGGHLRIFDAQTKGLLQGTLLNRFSETTCPQESQSQTLLRRRYAVDPWGMSYWLHSETLPDGSLKLTVYSFGPNRRRDSGESFAGADISAVGDDIVETATLKKREDKVGPPPVIF
jgi:hypothetical protein